MLKWFCDMQPYVWSGYISGIVSWNLECKFFWHIKTILNIATHCVISENAEVLYLD